MAFESLIIVQLLLQERDRLFAYIWSFVGDAHLAEDVFQEVSLLATQKGHDITDLQHATGWLHHTARLKALEILRTRRRMPAALDVEVADLLEEEWARYNSERQADETDALRECIKRLTPYCRQILALRYAEGLSPGDVARQLGRKLTTMYQALTRIHGSLADCVHKRLSTAAPHEKAT